MGMSLKLLPFYSNGAIFSQDILTVRCCVENYKDIKDLPQIDVPENFNSFLSREGFEESHYGNTTEDGYGNQLMATKAKYLKQIETSEPWIQYIKALDDDIDIALYWD